MKNERVKLIFWWLALWFIFSIFVILFTNIEYESYKKSTNQFVYSIIETLKEKYPDVEEKEIINILNNNQSGEYDSTLKKYGIKENDSILLQFESSYKRHIIFNLFILSCSMILLGILFFWYYFRKEKRIKEITNYMKEINQKNYTLGISDNGEGELSILRNEVYKTTIMLREESERLKQEKLSLKDSISDISHQLKTPLTSMLIMLDNIIDNPKMDDATKNEFVMNVRHQVEHINFLIVILLKLSRIEAGVVEFKKEKIFVQKIMKDVIKNIEILKEVKNVDIYLNIDKSISFIGDYGWELEALTNILKNGVEHSKEFGKIDIEAIETPLFTKIIIKDYGSGMDKKELQNIFKRFYKGKNSSSDSIGIGLNLAKNILEKDNAYIKVDSKKSNGTTFEIKFIKER